MEVGMSQRRRKMRQYMHRIKKQNIKLVPRLESYLSRLSQAGGSMSSFGGMMALGSCEECQATARCDGPRTSVGVENPSQRGVEGEVRPTATKKLTTGCVGSWLKLAG
jgi:hypothetical protein